MVNICYRLIFMAVYKNAWNKLSPLMIRHKSVFGFCSEDVVKKLIPSSLLIFGTNLKPCPALFLLQVQQRPQVPPCGKLSRARRARLVWPKPQAAARNSSGGVLPLLWNASTVVSCSFSNRAPIPSHTVLINIWREGWLQSRCLQITEPRSFFTASPWSEWSEMAAVQCRGLGLYFVKPYQSRYDFAKTK